MTDRPVLTPAQRNAMKMYADGVKDGMAIVLQLSLGREMEGGTPYRGVLPESFLVWAESALRRLRDAGVTLAVEHAPVAANEREAVMARIPGTFKTQVETPYRDRSQEGLVAEKMLLYAGALTAEGWIIGKCTVMVAREPVHDGFHWHLSISHPVRYPTWDEIKTAVYGIPVLEGVTMAQILGPVGEGEWVNVSENCFHLYEIPNPWDQQ